MSWNIFDNGNIIMTKGDTPSFKVSLNVRDEENNLFEYEPQEGDRIIFAMRVDNDDEEEVMIKEIPTDTLILQFYERDTKDLEYGSYLYEISLKNGDYNCTFITNKKIKITTEIW